MRLGIHFTISARVEKAVTSVGTDDSSIGRPSSTNLAEGSATAGMVASQSVSQDSSIHCSYGRAAS